MIISEGKQNTTINNEPYFVGKDIATILGYKLERKAIRDHVDSEDVLKWNTPTNSGIQEMTIINESGLYSLILSSKLPTSKQFKRWVNFRMVSTSKLYLIKNIFYYKIY